MTPRDPTLSTLDESLSQSHQLAALISAAWESTPLFAAPRTRAAQGLCAVSLHHGAGVLTLLPSLPGSAITLMRPQFETLVRAVWAAHAASDAELACLLAPLVPESQQAAKKLPGIPEMLSRLELSGPRGAAPLLARARTRLGDVGTALLEGPPLLLMIGTLGPPRLDQVKVGLALPEVGGGRVLGRAGPVRRLQRVDRPGLHVRVVRRGARPYGAITGRFPGR